MNELLIKAVKGIWRTLHRWATRVIPEPSYFQGSKPGKKHVNPYKDADSYYRPYEFPETLAIGWDTRHNRISCQASGSRYAGLGLDGWLLLQAMNTMKIL
jgi:hypothetical protein